VPRTPLTRRVELTLQMTLNYCILTVMVQKGLLPGRTRKKKVLLADPHPLTRQGLMTLLEDLPGFIVCAQTTDARSTMAAVSSQKPDLAIVDLSLPDKPGIDLIEHLKTTRPTLRILVLTMQDEVVYAERTLKAGATGYVMKTADLPAITAAIESVSEDRVYLSPAMTEHTLRRLAGKGSTDEETAIASLSDRQLQVLRLVAEGLGPKAIAKRLHVATKTVETHRDHIRQKLGLKSAQELRRYAIRWARTSKPGPPTIR